MNEQYLYRGKRLDNGEWVVGYYVPHGETATIVMPVGVDTQPIDNEGWANAWIVMPETVSQCTGLRDRNGTLMFENDILRIDCKDIHGEAKVAFSRGAFVVGDYQLGELLGDFMAFDLEIVGNVYDNPELLGDARVDDDSKPKTEPWAMLCRQRDVAERR